jgi:hypothetical protein
MVMPLQGLIMFESRFPVALV